MKSPSVYDFGEDDEGVEPTSTGLLMKFVNKGGNVQHSEIKDVFGIAYDGNIGDQRFSDFGTYAAGPSGRDFSLQEETSVLNDIVVSTSTSNNMHVKTSEVKFHAGNLIPGFSIGNLSLRSERLDCAPPEFPSDEVVSDDDGSMDTSSLPNSASDIAENEDANEHPTSVECFSGYEDMEKENHMEFTISPDFVLYGDGVATCSQLTFTAECIKCEDLNVVGSNKSFDLKWELDDISHIRSQWSQNTETCLITLRLTSAAVLGIDDVPSKSGIEQVVFTFNDPHWRYKEQMVRSVALGFKDKWNTTLEGVKENSDLLSEHQDMFFLRRYFANSNEPFEDVVYPKGDPDAVSISRREVELLQPETFVNDTIIDFYIKYLNNKIQAEDKHRFHFFNSFFFRKLADLDKDPGSALEGKAAFQRVRKWTRKIKLFEKDYIFIPVNYNLHWSLIVICHPGDIVHFSDERNDKDCKVPCILHMDSIKGSHNCLKNLIQSYLCEEWKVRNDTSEDISLKFQNLRFISLELPQQENSFDCGLFLLHYVELFLEDAPANFSPFKITKFCDFLNMDWFPPAEASHKRCTIQKLIYELLDDQRQKTHPPSCKDHCQSPSIEDTGKEHAVEFLSSQCSPQKKACIGKLISSNNAEIARAVLAPSDGVQCEQKGTVLQDFLDQGAIGECFSNESHQPCDQIASIEKENTSLLPTEQEDAEAGEQLLCSDRSDNQVKSLVVIEPHSTLCDIKDTAALEMSCFKETATQPREDTCTDRSCESSSCFQPNSSDIGVINHEPPLQNGETVEFIEEEKVNRQRSGSAETCGNAIDSPAIASSTPKLEGLPFEDSVQPHNGDGMAESKPSGEQFISHQEYLPASSCGDIESTKANDVSSMSPDESSTDVNDSFIEQPHKRQKLEPPELQMTD